MERDLPAYAIDQVDLRGGAGVPAGNGYVITVRGQLYLSNDINSAAGGTPRRHGADLSSP